VRMSCSTVPGEGQAIWQQYLDSTLFLPRKQKAESFAKIYGLTENQLARYHKWDEVQINQHRKEYRTEFGELTQYHPVNVAWLPTHEQELALAMLFIELSIEEAESIVGRGKGMIQSLKNEMTTLRRRVRESESELEKRSIQEVFRIRSQATKKKLFTWLVNRLGYGRSKQILDMSFSTMEHWWGTALGFKTVTEMVPPQLQDPDKLMRYLH
ncbi:MAG: hypothetical protein AAF804_06275, partial [Bacteroidota bacterium]